MTEKYTYQDWLDDIEIPIAIEDASLGDVYLTMLQKGILEKEDYNQIKSKQEWTYDNLITNHCNFIKSDLARRLSEHKFPDELYKLELKAHLEEKERYIEYLSEVIDGYKDFHFASGSDYLSVKKGRMPFFISLRKNQGLGNGNLELAIALDLIKEIKTLSIQQFIKKWGDREESKKVGRKKSNEFTVEDAKNLITKYKKEFGKKNYRNKYNSDGHIIQYQFVKYALDNGVSVSESTIIRRFREVKK